jgi:DNA-directed RNA polymerase specialized sigma24 family protein
MIWDHFFRRLCAFAETKIYKRHRRLISADEIASNAFLALVDGIREKRFEKVRNRDELWKMLTLIAARKAVNLRKRHDRAKRGNGQIKGGSVFGAAGINSVADFLQRDLAPDVGAQILDLSQQLLKRLPTDELRNVALWRMAGYSNVEIAEKLGCVERTVERKLNLIRAVWGKLIDSDDDREASESSRSQR